MPDEAGDEAMPDEAEDAPMPDEAGDEAMPDEAEDAPTPDEAGDEAMPDEAEDAPPPRWQQFEIDGCQGFLVTGPRSQTVNVCTHTQKRGEYDWTIRVPSRPGVETDQLERHTTIDSLISWLVNERFGETEHSPFEDNPDEAIVFPDAVSDETENAWIAKAMRITEFCIDSMVEEFLELPYLHRVEHSIHMRLFSILRMHPHFSVFFPLGDGATLTQPVHKEWPEAIPRPEKENRRGNFDLAVLSPASVRSCSLIDFTKGYIPPAIAIEMGLNYGDSHLVGDAEKLINSSPKMHCGYLVHLVRGGRVDPRVEETIAGLSENRKIKVAYGLHSAGNKFVKLIDDKSIRQLD